MDSFEDYRYAGSVNVRNYRKNYIKDHHKSRGVKGSNFESKLDRKQDDSAPHAVTNFREDGISNHNGGDDNVGNGDVHEIETEAQTKTVQRWRIVVFLTLLAVGGSVTTIVYLLLNQAKKGSISHLDEYFNLLVSSVGSTVESRVTSAKQSLLDYGEYLAASSATTPPETVNDSNSSSNVGLGGFPFLTDPQFHIIASHLHHMYGIEALEMLPYLSSDELEAWAQYSVNHIDSWTLHQPLRSDEFERVSVDDNAVLVTPSASKDGTITPSSGTITPHCYELQNGAPVPVASNREIYSPKWQSFMISTNNDTTTPTAILSPIAASAVNFDTRSAAASRKLLEAMDLLRAPVLGELASAHDALGELDPTGWDVEAQLASSSFDDEHQAYPLSNNAYTALYAPIFENHDSRSGNTPVVASLVGWMAWDFILTDAMPSDSTMGMYAVIGSSCGATVTYELFEKEVAFLGTGDLHDIRYSDKVTAILLHDFVTSSVPSTIEGHCRYILGLYPSGRTLVTSTSSALSILFVAVVASTFVMMIIVFVVYDRYVDRRNKRVASLAAKSNVIVSSLFPSAVRDRMFAEAGVEGEKQPKSQTIGKGNNSRSRRLRDVLLDGHVIDDENLSYNNELGAYKTRPIAELFPETTIIFGDIAAWSSSREPTQVFQLLETIYHAFDELAQKNGVYKIETVGDCYVAACGLPEPRKDHAVVVSLFARDCMKKISILTKQLELTLGPDTGELSLRVGLHSGPVTAGVLRGERSRFQLFGDTMNVASRMESTGIPGRIQISQDTADLLRAADRGTWYIPREDTINAKGKGKLKTYWLNYSDPRRDSQGSSAANEQRSKTEHDDEEADRRANELAHGKTARLIDWNIDVLKPLLKQCIVSRRIQGVTPQIFKGTPGWKRDGATYRILDEVREVIELPPNHFAIDQVIEEARYFELDDDVEHQLRLIVANIAAMYNRNPFHNFEHASHMTMSVVKLLSRIVEPNPDFCEDQSLTSLITDDTYDLLTNPLTQFSCIFSALVHDIDHPGVPNCQLVREECQMAGFYRKSIAEQNSLEISWDLLQDESFGALRAAIHGTREELFHFRQLVVNAVMATDIMDDDLKRLRYSRWQRAFTDIPRTRTEEALNVNRKATIVIELLMQASDVAHTMQHWQIYRKWNERLMMEVFAAYHNGRSDVTKGNPLDSWYQGELSFFDNYILPLAHKLKECGVFGVSCEEYLNYAIMNRREWEARGEDVVNEMRRIIDLV